MFVMEKQQRNEIIWISIAILLLLFLGAMAIWQPAFFNFLRFGFNKKRNDPNYLCWEAQNSDGSGLSGSVIDALDGNSDYEIPTWDNGGGTSNPPPVVIDSGNGSYNDDYADSEGAVSDPIIFEPVTASCPMLLAASFNIAADKTLDIEGQYQNKASDNGNWTGCKRNKGVLSGTNYGLSACFLSDLYGYPVTADYVKQITKGQAMDIYKQHFWDAIRLSEVLNQPLANIIFDSYVHKPKWTIQNLQDTINKIGYSPVLWKDNIMGQKTLTAINYYAATNPAILYTEFRKKRRDYYQSIAADFPQFIDGWLARIDSFDDYI